MQRAKNPNSQATVKPGYALPLAMLYIYVMKHASNHEEFRYVVGLGWRGRWVGDEGLGREES